MSQEPVNIMGVVAFPNENGQREIRFIDSEYNKLFTVPDGGNIILTHFDGKSVILPCRYIDDYHAQIGASVYHICQFAEVQERSGSVYAPEIPKTGDVFDTYEIYQIQDVAGTDYCFRPYREAAKTFNPSDYQRVYAGMYAKDASLEQLWVKHNRDTRPFGQKMRSMSMSDVVVLTRGGKKEAYYADSFGFQEVANFTANEQKKSKKRSEPER